MPAQNMAIMPRKRTTDTEPYRRPNRMARIREQLAEQVDLARENSTQDFTEFVNECVRERLKVLGFWPPQSKSD